MTDESGTGTLLQAKIGGRSGRLPKIKPTKGQTHTVLNREQIKNKSVKKRTILSSSIPLVVSDLNSAQEREKTLWISEAFNWILFLCKSTVFKAED